MSTLLDHQNRYLPAVIPINEIASVFPVFGLKIPYNEIRG